MTVFADSSAAVKLYADESGSESIRTLEAMYVSQLIRVEIPAALWRKERMGDIDVAACADLIALFEADYFDDNGPFAVIRIGDADFEDAATLVATHGLRAYDAIQLSTAIKAADVDAGCDTFAAFDAQLRLAAAREGFTLLPANESAVRPHRDS